MISEAGKKEYYCDSKKLKEFIKKNKITKTQLIKQIKSKFSHLKTSTEVYDNVIEPLWEKLFKNLKLLELIDNNEQSLKEEKKSLKEEFSRDFDALYWLIRALNDKKRINPYNNKIWFNSLIKRLLEIINSYKGYENMELDFFKIVEIQKLIFREFIFGDLISNNINLIR